MAMFGIKVPWRKRRLYKYAVLAKMEVNVIGERILTVIPPDSYIEQPNDKYIILLTADPTFTVSIPGYAD